MTTMHEIEEMEFGRTEGLWDAGDVCCAYFQTGACSHTEDTEYGDYPMPTLVVVVVSEPSDEPF